MVALVKVGLGLIGVNLVRFRIDLGVGVVCGWSRFDLVRVRFGMT